MHPTHYHQHPSVPSHIEHFPLLTEDNARSSSLLLGTGTDFDTPNPALDSLHGSLQTAEHSHVAPAGEQYFLTSEDKTKLRLVRAGEWVLAFSNAGVAVPEFAVAVVRKAGVAAMDSLHNWFDFLGYLKQLRLIVMASPEGQEAFNTGSRFKMWGNIKQWLAQSNINDETKLEKSSFALISLPAIGAAALAGAGLVGEIAGSSDNNGVDLADMAHLGAAGAALTLAGALMHTGRRMVRKVEQTDSPNSNLARHANNFYAHAKLDATSSGAAVAESLIHMAGSGVWAVNLAVLAISGYQVWRFWPSRAGRQEPHAHESEHEHGHHHDECNHAHLVSHETIDIAAAGLRRVKAIGSVAVHGIAITGDRVKSVIERGRSWLGRMRYKPAHSHERPHAPSRLRSAMGLGATALALVGGLISGDTQSKNAVHATPDVVGGPAAVDIQPDNPITPPPPTVKLPSTTECVTVKAGDSQWKIVERRVAKATGKRPSVSATNVIAMFTAIKNKVSNPQPGTIYAGDCLQVPTYAATQELYDALGQPRTSDPRLAASLKTFNEQRNIQEVLDNDAAFIRIDSYLQRVLSL
ncbi:MAG TPA: hypothetical protein VJ836_07645 [Candidatus Saccharimonadales bacterium]|nr:hypothetical protein [Candidatus Saccharimonadales bacterium]